MGRNIVVLSYRDMQHPEAGGAEVIMYEVFRRLAASGHRVTFVTGGFRGGERETTLDGMRVIRVGSTYTFNIAGVRRVRALRREETVDVVVEDINKIPFFTPTFVSDVPTLGVVPHLFGTTVYEEASWPIATYVYLHERFIPRGYGRAPFSVLSESTRDDLVGRGISKERVHVVYAGLDLTAYPADPDRPVPAPVITYLGQIKKYKGIDLVMEALPAVLERIPKAVYRIIGEGDHRERLEARARELGVAESVEFLGFRGGEEKLRLLRETRALVYTSPKEGWGLSVIEAGALGVPTLASDSPGLRESVRHGETGYLVPHGDVPAIAERLVTLLSDDGEWRRLSDGALSWARTFSWDRTASETAALIEEAIRIHAAERTRAR